MEMDQSRAAQAQLREVLGTSTPFSFGGSGTAKKSERETEEADKDLQPASKFPRGQNKGAQGGKGWKEAQTSYTGQGGGIRPDEADRRTVAREVHGQESYGEPPGNADAALLGEIQDRMVKTVESEEQLQRCLNIGWMAEGTTKLNPVYRYYRWNPETRTQEHCETPPLSHTAALTHVQTLQELVVQPNVLTRFRSTRPLSKDPKGEVVPFLLSLSLRQSQAGKCHEALTALSGNACLKLAGLRLRPDRGQKQPLMKELEQAYLAVPYTDWTAREQTWNRAAPHPEKATEELTNSGNVCYVNAVAQALAWLGKHTLPGSLPWMPVFANWPQMHRQQDAGSFCAHLLAYAQPRPLLAPIPVEVQGSTLQGVIDHWPGERIGLPVFLDSAGLDMRTVRRSVLSALPRQLDDICRELALPSHIYYDSLEELLLLNTLQCLMAAVGKHVPPSLSMASTNELCHMACRLLPEDELRIFQDYACRLGCSMPGTDAVCFPPALGQPHDGMRAAEHAAACYLQEGSGSLWSAVRHVVSLLPFRDVKRQHQPHPQSQFSAGAYGHRGFVGLCKQTEQFGSVLRLLNLLICSLHSGFSWTTVVITVNNVAGLHVDKQNAPFCSLVFGLSHHSQGHMWIQSTRGMPWTGPGLVQPANGYRLDVAARAYLLPTFSHPHCTEASTQGDRLVLIAYVIGQYECL
ncbi:RER1C, partial [Symbiodinium sp. KB8]